MRPLQQICLDKDDGKLPGSHKSSNLNAMHTNNNSGKIPISDLDKSIDSAPNLVLNSAKIAKFKLNKALKQH